MEEYQVEEQATAVCPSCGAPIADGQVFCGSCGASLTPPQPVKRICECGTELGEDQLFCPKCGKRYGEPTPPISAPAKPFDLKKIIVPAAIAVGALILGIIIFFVVRGTPVSSVSLNRVDIMIDEGMTEKLICTVNPSDAKDKSLTWESTNNSVATVTEQGVVKGISPGVCSITVRSKNGKTAECKVTVEVHIPDFKELFSSKGGLQYVSIAGDGSWMQIDTNPTNKDSDNFLYSDYTVMSDACDLIKEVNEKLGFSSALYEKMTSTTALQGRQSDENSQYKVSWTYHPDKGLEVMYEMKVK